MRIQLDSTLADDCGWSTAPAQAQRRLSATKNGAALRDDGGRVLQRWDNPLAALDWLDAQRSAGGRWVGFVAYELGALLEPAVAARSGRSSRATRCDGAFQSESGRAAPEAGELLYAWGWVPNSRRTAPRQRRTPAAQNPSPPRQPPAVEARPPLAERTGAMADGQPLFDSNFTRRDYLDAVKRCINYISAGDVFQINLSQRLAVKLDAVERRSGPRTQTAGNASDFRRLARQLYGAIEARTPAPYASLLELDDWAVISNSPELFLRVLPNRTILTRPIKGTRPRLPGMDRELLQSAKDAAELNMIVDLERNDLGRVCEIGSVRVSEPRTIEAHPTVFHGVATVEGRLRQRVGLVELLRATFPGGSVTGAPKIRAMQIISELEPEPRGVYCGAIGHLDADSLQLSLAIRTMTLHRGRGELIIPVGGGIVADSDPAAEYEETLVKARAALDGIAAVCGGPLVLANH